MPFVVTTSKKGPRGPFDSSASVSRVAVASLEDARQSAVNKVCKSAFDAGTIEGYEQHETDARAIDESGGTVGPLPDGTLIEVERVGWDTLATLAPNTLTTSRGFPVPRTEGEVIAAFNEASR